MAANNILTFKIGDETRPKVEELLVNPSQHGQTEELPFFYEVYEKALTLIADILQQNNKEKNDNINSDLTQERNNIIAFVGDRGTGKTSSMNTVYNVFKMGGNSSQIKFGALDDTYNIIKQYKILTLPTIDPSYFEERHNILDIVVAHMFDSFDKESKSTIRTDEYKNKDKQSLIKRFQEVKACLDVIKQKPNRSNETIEDLSALASGINLKKSIGNLVESYLTYFCGGKRNVALAIAIDDIDLQTRHAYEMVEQLRKYLIQPNVLILMGVKISQLNDLVKQHYYKENKELISANLLTDTTENMAGRYLSKLIPFNQRIFMPSVGDHSSKMIKITGGENQLEEDKVTGPISAVVLNLIFIKTRYLFYHTDSNPSLIVPRNLRDLLNLLSLLYHMPNIPSEVESPSDDSTYNEATPAQLVIQKNRSRFRNYFIDTWCCENLSAEMFAFIKELETLEVAQINKNVIDFLLRINRASGDSDSINIHFESEIVNASNRSYNVSLGDVCYILDKVSNNYGIEHINNFVFAVKTLYSFFLYQLFEDKGRDMEERLSYLQMQYDTKHKKFDSQKHLRKMTKMMVLSGYEKLLGGNLIRVANLSHLPATICNSNDKNSKDDINDYYHLKVVNSAILKELNKFILNHHKEIFKQISEGVSNVRLTIAVEIKSDKIAQAKYFIKIAEKSDSKGQIIDDNHIYKPLFNVKWDKALNIWEFFILTTYLNTDRTYFRTQKQCYYLHIPSNYPLDFSSPIIYSSAAILFNIVKFYDCYCLCEYWAKNGVDLLKDKNWDRFWEVIQAGTHKYSMLWRMLHYKGKDESENPSHPQARIKFVEKMPNHDLERIFIRNMEVLDVLGDYLPNMKRKDNDVDTSSQKAREEAIESYTEFYNKLSQFQFSLFPRTIDDLKGKNQNIVNQIHRGDRKYFVSFGALKEMSVFLEELKKDEDALKLFCEIMYNKQTECEIMYNNKPEEIHG